MQNVRVTPIIDQCQHHHAPGRKVEPAYGESPSQQDDAGHAAIVHRARQALP